MYERTQGLRRPVSVVPALLPSVLIWPMVDGFLVVTCGKLSFSRRDVVLNVGPTGVSYES